jgi:hypothetical protein
MNYKLLPPLTTLAFSLLPVLTPNLAVAQTVTSTAPAPSYQSPVYQAIARDVAAQSAVNVQVAPGRTSTIDFSQTDEVMTYVLLADPSRLVYTTNAELESGQAKTLFLRTIERLNFPGATCTDITNLPVQTIDSTGQQQLYNFNIVPISSTPRYIGIAITPAVAGHQTLTVNGSRSATLNDVEAGLEIAINRGYTSSDDPIVLGIRQFLALARNNNITLQQAAASANVPLSVVTELAEIALEEPATTPVQQHPASAI